ncbi:MAG: DNA-directed RNA polymerase, subunit E'' [Desulfurococcales archaeon]|nr:DNA-directed RNA polymerase, subunit E'' [Desulfurococcales archaeon]
MAGKPRLKACRNCGALVPRDASVCPVCKSTSFTEDWEGMVIIISTDSVLASELEIEKPGMYAIKVSGRIVKRK